MKALIEQVKVPELGERFASGETPEHDLKYSVQELCSHKDINFFVTPQQ